MILHFCCEDNFVYFLVTLYSFSNLFITFFNYVIHFYFLELHTLLL